MQNVPSLRDRPGPWPSSKLRQTGWPHRLCQEHVSPRTAPSNQSVRTGGRQGEATQPPSLSRPPRIQNQRRVCLQVLVRPVLAASSTETPGVGLSLLSPQAVTSSRGGRGRGRGGWRTEPLPTETRDSGAHAAPMTAGTFWEESLCQGSWFCDKGCWTAWGHADAVTSEGPGADEPHLEETGGVLLGCPPPWPPGGPEADS